MARRRKQPPAPRVRAVVYLQPNGYRKLDALARAFGVTHSGVMNLALERMHHAEAILGHVARLTSSAK